MKILWTTNGAIYKSAMMILNDSDKRSSGGWVIPYLCYLKSLPDVTLILVSSGDNNEIIYNNKENVISYILPGGHPVAKYNGYSKKNITLWKDIIKTEAPDIIHIWGCESSIGIAALRACENVIPSIISVQGSGVGIDRCSEAGIERKTQKKIATLRDYLRLDTMWMQHRRYYKLVKNEKLLLQYSKNIIVENQWCSAICSNIVPDIRIHKLPLAINPIFFTKTWSDKFVKHTVMCPLSYSPIKGHHMLFKAMGIVKKRYPDAVIKIPGTKKSNNGVLYKLKEAGYTRYLDQLINENNLVDSIEYLGILSSEEMAKHMQSSNVFVMCSAIENQCATLKEAMTVGVPCVASDVGGVTDYARHRENALVYRFEDYELLASYICECFENEDLCRTLSANARKYAYENWSEDKTVEPIVDIYKSIIKENTNDEQ